MRSYGGRPLEGGKLLVARIDDKRLFRVLRVEAGLPFHLGVFLGIIDIVGLSFMLFRSDRQEEMTKAIVR